MRKTVRVLLCMVWLMLCAALPAFGAESAPHVTAETTMAQLRANPAIQGSGYYTYCREMTPLMVERWKNKTLHDYFGDTDRESGIAALNLIIDNYNKGVKVTYQVYTLRRSNTIPVWAVCSCFIIRPRPPTPKPLS